MGDHDIVEAGMSKGAYRYCVYGVTVTSEIPLALPEHADGHLATVDISIGSEKFFADAVGDARFASTEDDWFQYAPLPDGSSYVRTTRVGEFLVYSDGLKIVVRQFADASSESFQVYMLGRAISFALVKQGFEPLHGTVAVVDGKALVFLGESGFGKSSLAASFLHAQYPILTDDLLILEHSDSGIHAFPGPPRIKVFPNIARRFLGRAAAGTPMNPDTNKLILALKPHQCHTGMVPLGAIYSLVAPGSSVTSDAASRPQGIEIRELSARDSFLELVKHTFNYRLVNPERLERQFCANTKLASLTPVRKLAYPRILKRLAEVREAIVEDFRSLEKARPVQKDDGEVAA